jgi:glycosyltransferase involved in cell wall biosynthesis
MHIAQLAPPTEAVPPARYGGTERVIATLIAELQQQGHRVTLFASGDSQTAATLVPTTPHAVRRSASPAAQTALRTTLDLVSRHAAAFDVIHSHLDYPGFDLERRLGVPVLHTLHGRLDIPPLVTAVRRHPDVALVALSASQRQTAPQWPWLGTVPNGIPLARYTFRPQPGQYLAFLGRITPDKGIEEAITVAKRAGLPLRVAAKVDPVDAAYFEQRVRPLFALPGIEYVGEIGDAEKDAFLGNALALLFPIQWPEPFGLVMAEAMATGTPVLATSCGAVREVVVDGVTGFVRASVDGLVDAVQAVGRLDRAACRERVEQCFSGARMAAGYAALYEQLRASRREPAPRRTRAVPERLLSAAR